MMQMKLLAMAVVSLAAWLPIAASAQPVGPVPPSGTGLGVHSPDSPFAPLSARADVVPWTVLGDISYKTEKTRLLPVFKPAQLAMDQQKQRIQGFMMPLQPGERQSHFLLTSVPMSCSFCTPGGPESMVEVRSRTPLKYSLEPVVVEGQFSLLRDDPYGLLYRVLDAISVK
jgi:hypothetical protein